VLGVTGFKTVADLVDRCDCYTLTYHNLHEALARIREVTAASPATAV
jgi:NifU-like protein involved in Fe-S cluster formation